MQNLTIMLGIVLVLVAPIYLFLLVDTYVGMIREIRLWWRHHKDRGGGMADFPRR